MGERMRARMEGWQAGNPSISYARGLRPMLSIELVTADGSPDTELVTADGSPDTELASRVVDEGSAGASYSSRPA
jgi:4-aminobutyrate aminotransferase-like enzyme